MDNAYPLLWPGNSAKSKIIGRVLTESEGRDEVRIFDYGCGDGHGWLEILPDYPRLRLFFFDLNQSLMAAAIRNLAGLRAEPVQSDPLHYQPLEADFVVSLSVLEHVLDRPAYMAAVARHLRPGGTCFLNYDDGHFRNSLSLNDPLSTIDQVKEWGFNLLSRFGIKTRFQKRVTKAEADRLAAQAGLTLVSDFYSNLPCLKGFHGHLEKTSWPPEKRTEFVARWLELEDWLNEEFRKDLPEPVLGDPTNLWSRMLSRTMVLRK